MKRNYLYSAIISLMFLCGISSIKAQENTKQDKNPFPLSAKEIKKLLVASERTVNKISGQYLDINLTTWKEKDREAYLKAKATKVVLLFAPDFYRTYKIEIIRKISEENYTPGLGPNRPYYRVTFYYDMEKEKLDTKGIAIYVRVWEENGQADGFMLPAYNFGHNFNAPDWENGFYEKRKKENKPLPIYSYMAMEPYIRPFWNVRNEAEMDSLREINKRFPREELDSLWKAGIRTAKELLSLPVK